MKTSSSAQTIIEVPLDNGTTWTGTERELRAKHPDWLPYARIVQPATPDEDESDELTEAAQDVYDDPRPGRLPTSARTYHAVPRQKIRYEYHQETPIRRRSSATTSTGAGTRETEDIPQAARRTRKRRVWHPLWYLGLGMMVMLGLWQGLAALGTWWQVHLDDSMYGRPRTAQYDVVVGHEDSAGHPTHIIAINLNNRVVIIELPGGEGDLSKSRIYTGPQLFGSGSDLDPVTLTFKDTTGNGRLDMIVHVQGAQIVYLNQKINGIWQFVPPQNH